MSFKFSQIDLEGECIITISCVLKEERDRLIVTRLNSDDFRNFLFIVVDTVVLGYEQLDFVLVGGLIGVCHLDEH